MLSCKTASMPGWKMCNEMDAIQDRKKPPKRMIEAMFSKAQSNVGPDSKKNRGYRRKSVTPTI